jgi:hypothetical protein
LRQNTGSFTPGFVLLAVFAAACLLLCWSAPRLVPAEAK